MQDALSEFLEDFMEQIKSSRDNALAGKYEDALACYDGYVSQQTCARVLACSVFHLS